MTTSQKKIVDFFSSGKINFAVCDQHTTKGGNRIAGQGSVVCFEHGLASGDATSVVVFEDGKSGRLIREKTRRIKIYRSINIK
jgi:hypothetical protein